MQGGRPQGSRVSQSLVGPTTAARIKGYVNQPSVRNRRIRGASSVGSNGGWTFESVATGLFLSVLDESNTGAAFVVYSDVTKFEMKPDARGSPCCSGSIFLRAFYCGV